MSGILGIFGEGPPERQLGLARQMVSAIDHRGIPTAQALPNNRGVVAQLRHPAACDGLHIADRAIVGMAGRLDEPEDLATALELPFVPSDDVLVYHAFLRWGVEFVERIQGDYAIFIWDREEERLLLVRDRFGVEPLYYAVAGASVLFASEIKAILAARPELQAPLREELIADYVAGIHAAEPEETIYAQVLRLPAASVAIIRSGAVIVRSYYTLDPTSRPPGKSAPEQFADCLRVAVHRRMRASGKVGALLSGGLDSSSIVSLAAPAVTGQCELQTFTSFFEGDPAGEEPFARAVRHKYGLGNPVFINGDEAGPFADLPLRLQELDRPPYGPNYSLARHVARSAASMGTAQVVLCGHGGDEIVSSGASFLKELAQAGEWRRLWSEIGDTGALGHSRAQIFAGLLFGNSRLSRRMTRAGRLLGLAAAKPAGDPWTHYVSGRIAGSAHFQDRYHRNPPAPVDGNLPLSVRSHAAMVCNPMQVEAFEDLDQTRSPSGLLFRYPFWDRNLIELAISLPGEEKWSCGWPRVLLRRAMKGILPEEVAWRPDKYDYVPRFTAALRGPDSLSSMSRALNDDADLVSPYVNVRHARTLLQELQEGGACPESLFYLWRVTVLSCWLAGRGKHVRAAD